MKKIYNKIIPFQGYKAMTVWPVIFVRSDARERFIIVDENHIKALLGIDDSRISVQRNTNILKNLVSGEGWLLTRITGPGKVFLSSVPSYMPRQQSI